MIKDTSQLPEYAFVKLQSLVVKLLGLTLRYYLCVGTLLNKNSRLVSAVNGKTTLVLIGKNLDATLLQEMLMMKNSLILI